MTGAAFVVGGSGGIGTAICRQLAERGLTVAIGYRTDRQAAEEVLRSLDGHGHQLVRVDIGDTTSLESAASNLEDWQPCLDVLVNGAGITRLVPHEDLDGLDDQLIDDILRVNWRGPFATIRVLRPFLAAADNPVVINLSSIAGTTGYGSNVAYCASKAALDSLTRSLGRALAPQIRVVSVAPGWVIGDYASRMPREILEAQCAETPMGRLATADDVARTVVAAAFDLPFTTGAVLPVDGGRPLGTS